MCGIIGILGSEPIGERIYHGMIHLQHRGQDSSGVFLCDPAFSQTLLRRKSGWVFPFFQETLLANKMCWGLGHIRYSTSGKGKVEDAQPLTLILGNTTTLGIVHNGNLVNYPALRQELEEEGCYFTSDCDSEAIINLLGQQLDLTKPFFDTLCSSVEQIHERCVGSYSIIGSVKDIGLFAFRDPQGIRPLLMGKDKNTIAFASETLALSSMGCSEITDIEPGEVVFVNPQGQIARRLLTQEPHCHCAFEFNYFAKTPTIIEGQEVYSIRAALGRSLAEKIRSQELPAIDVVIPIPETGNPSGIALAHALNLPVEEGFSRHNHSGRTFIIAGQEKRQTASFQKLAPIRSVFANKSVLLVDDSIIRGTVSKRTVSLAREAGAKTVIFASTFPPVLYPCVYGIDFPTKEQLIAAYKTVPEICTEIGADAVIYNDIDSLKKAIGLKDLCLACVSGRYPTSTEGMAALEQKRKEDLVFV